MVLREEFRSYVNSLPEGVIVSATDFGMPREYRATLVKALNQYESLGVLRRASKGRYYKPRKSRFGEVKPSENEIVKEFLEKDGNTIGYITGTRAFAGLALTTQVSPAIVIGTNVPRRPVMRGQYKISFLLQPNPLVKDDIPYYVILDALRLIKEIPATTPDESISQIMAWVKELPNEGKYRLVELSRVYSPSVRAQLGAILEYLGYFATTLMDTLNPLSHYKIGITPDTLPTAKTWNII